MDCRHLPAWLRVGLIGTNRPWTHVRIDILPDPAFTSPHLGIHRSLFRDISILISDCLDFAPKYLDQNNLIRQWDYPISGNFFTPSLLVRSGPMLTRMIDTSGFSIAEHMAQISSHDVLRIGQKHDVLYATK